MTRLERVRNAILTERPWWMEFLITVGVLAFSTGLRFLLGKSANPVPFVTFYPAALLLAVFLGWRWAVVAALSSAIIVNRLFLQTPWLAAARGAEVSILIFFALSCGFVIFVGHTLRRTVREMDVLSRERELFHRETFHRVQNMLTTMSALVRMSRKDTDVATFREELLQRLDALARANRLLREGDAPANDVAELVRQAISPFDRAGAFALSGPAHALPVEPARHLLLVLHELATNALKHGALSHPAGVVNVGWQAEGGRFALSWNEAGGPRVDPPARKGLGTRLIETQPVFAVAIRYEPDGVACHLRWPAHDNAADADGLTPPAVTRF